MIAICLALIDDEDDRHVFERLYRKLNKTVYFPPCVSQIRKRMLRMLLRTSGYIPRKIWADASSGWLYYIDGYFTGDQLVEIADSIYK